MNQQDLDKFKDFFVQNPTAIDFITKVYERVVGGNSFIQIVEELTEPYLIPPHWAHNVVTFVNDFNSMKTTSEELTADPEETPPDEPV